MENPYERLRRRKEELRRKVEEHDKWSRANQGKPIADVPFKYRFMMIAPLIATVLFAYGYSIYGFKQIKNAILTESEHFNRMIHDSLNREMNASMQLEETSASQKNETTYLVDNNDVQAENEILTDSDTNWRV